MLIASGWIVTTMATVACALAVSSCGGDTDLDACGLLRDEQAADILGVPVHSGTLDTDRTIPATFCVWIAEGSDTRESADETYSLWIAEGTDRATLQDLERDAVSSAAEPTIGLGQDSFYISDQYGTDLKLKVGDRAVTIGVDGDRRHPVSDSKERALLRRAAVSVVDRLS